MVLLLLLLQLLLLLELPLLVPQHGHAFGLEQLRLRLGLLLLLLVLLLVRLLLLVLLLLLLLWVQRLGRKRGEARGARHVELRRGDPRTGPTAAEAQLLTTARAIAGEDHRLVALVLPC